MRNKNLWTSAALGLSLIAASATFAPIVPDQCQEVRDQAIKPLIGAALYLKSGPSLDQLAGPGCATLLEYLELLPEAAQLMRDLGAHTVERAKSRCAISMRSIRYRCSGEPKRCLPETYRYCGQWSYSDVSQPEYTLAMELSTQAETAYDRAHQLCAAAFRSDAGAVRVLSRELVSYVETRIAPRAERLSTLGCGE